MATAVKELIAAACTPRGPKDDPIWRLTPFIDFPGEHNSRPYEFEWEREWRLIGQFEFELANVAFLVLPEAIHGCARSFFEEAASENTGPPYRCPFIDPHWSREKARRALRAHRIA